MDYRNRRYFLVTFRHSRPMVLSNIRQIDPSIKCHPPYGHFKYGEYDGTYHNLTKLPAPEMMLGCSKDKAATIISILEKEFGRWTGYYELTEFDCFQ